MGRRHDGDPRAGKYLSRFRNPTRQFGKPLGAPLFGSPVGRRSDRNDQGAPWNQICCFAFMSRRGPQIGCRRRIEIEKSAKLPDTMLAEIAFSYDASALGTQNERKGRTAEIDDEIPADQSDSSIEFEPMQRKRSL